jgi:hypothetical protein
MAKPIKETPILTGKDAVAFNKQLKVAGKVDDKERARIRLNFAKLAAIAKF